MLKVLTLVFPILLLFESVIAQEIPSPGTTQNQKDEKPSSTFDKPWLWARDKNSKDVYSDKIGKWMIFTSNENVDLTWQSIKREIEMGRLGSVAKVSTMFSSAQYKQRVIIVYTDDWTDRQDVMRVRQRLREIGHTERLYYKTDEMTRKGIYGQAEKDLAPYVD